MRQTMTCRSTRPKEVHVCVQIHTTLVMGRRHIVGTWNGKGYTHIYTLPELSHKGKPYAAKVMTSHGCADIKLATCGTCA
jgi:hypothetical protein